MNRRHFLATGIGAAAATRVGAAQPHPDARRRAFRRLRDETYINAAAGTPLGDFTEAGMQRYLDFLRAGPGEGRRGEVGEALGAVRGLFAEMVGARESEIGLVHCTKDGEQKVLDALDPIQNGRSVVTNDLHFTGSLHNLKGLQKAGLSLKIVRARNWEVDPAEMISAIDDRTALVTVSLVSNINGHVESMRAIADAAHAHQAFVFADIIQAAGIVPVDLRQLGVDFAACSAYKWLYGVHGTGFLYVREELQGRGLPDRLFPGHIRHNYSPWVEHPDPDEDDFIYQAPADASRYQPGHVSYVGYCGLFESLKWLQAVGVGKALEHSLRLNRRFLARLDRDRYQVISPHVDRSPILTLLVRRAEGVQEGLERARVTVSLAGRRVRISPGLYNNEADMDRLVDALNGAG